MIYADARPTAPATDPTRLLRSGTDAGSLLRGYAKRTRPGDRDGVAAWYRLRPRLDGAVARVPTSLPRIWVPARFLSGVLTVVLSVFVLVKLAPLGERPAASPGRARAWERQAAGGSGLGGASGSAETGVGGMEGAGGMERSPGARGSGGTAAARGLLVCPARLG